MAVVHLRSQLDVADFYARHADQILYYTGRSPFSIRHPRKRARYSVHRDPLFSEIVDRAPQTVEQEDRDYEYVRSYFTYTRYSQIYKFYESAEFRACERKYGLLARVDISKCFDSIYTHTITWATHGREATKANLGASKDTFAGEFDRLMQSINYDETNGIVIGPEVSRIFAEVILQEVDVRIHRQLQKLHLVHREDYDILRFVDDYFVFVRTDEMRATILEVVADHLSTFRLHLNESKETVEATPLASALSIAKSKLNRLLKEEITWQAPQQADADRVAGLPRLYVAAQSLVLGYKSILMDAELSHSELANYALVRLERASEQYLDDFRTPLTSDEFLIQDARFRADAMARVVGYLSATLDVAVFIYAGAVSVSHAVKLARIVMTAIKFLDVVEAETLHRESFLTKCSREIRSQLQPSQHGNAVPIHTLILLDCLTAMGARHRLSPLELRRLLDLRPDETLTVNSTSIDAASALTILSHVADDPKFSDLVTHIERWILRQIEDAGQVLSGEVSLLELNCISSPYVSMETKIQILSKYGRTRRDVLQLEQLNSQWTYEWSGMDYYERLQRKRSNEVY